MSMTIARPATKRAALYLRQSMDRDKRAEGVDRQRERCRFLAESRGWELSEEYVDNDVSASKPRGPGTAWHRLIEDAKAGRVDTVVAVDQDRVLRGIRDLVTLLDTGVRLATVDGEIDLTTADGEFRATLAAGLARFEVKRKSERQMRANQTRRGKGLPPGGRRAFGYTVTKDGATVNDFGHIPIPHEATAIRRAYTQFLGGESLRSIAREWNDAGLTTTTGGAWSAVTVRAVLSSPRYVALTAPPRDQSVNGATNALRLEVADLTPGLWEPLVDMDVWLAVRDMLKDPARRANPTTSPRALLSGISFCGICGSPMTAGVNNGVQNYKCRASSHLSRHRGDADEYVEHVTIAWLARPGATERLLHHTQTPDAEKVRADLLTAKAAEENVLALVAAGLTSMAAASASLQEIRARIAGLEARGADSHRRQVLGDLLDAADAAADDADHREIAVAEVWERMNIDRRRAVIQTILTVTMMPPGKGTRTPKSRAERLARTEATVKVDYR